MTDYSNGTEAPASYDRQGRSRYEAAVAIVENLVAEYNDPDGGEGIVAHYGRDIRRVETFMVAGNGPTAHVVFIWTLPNVPGEEAELDSCHLEYYDTDRCIVPIPDQVAEQLRDGFRNYGDHR